MGSKRTVKMTTTKWRGSDRFDNNSSNYEKMVNRFVTNFRKKIKQQDMTKFFKVKIKNTEIDVLPHLCNTSNLFDDRFLLSLCNCFKDEPLEVVESIDKLEKENCFDAYEMLSFLPLTKGSDEDMRFFVMYLYSKKPVQVAEVLVNYMFNLLCKYLSGSYEPRIISFKDKNVMNTEGFAFLISVYWFLKSVGNIEPLMGANLKKIGYYENLDECTPVDSIHFKYFRGEYKDSKELNNEYMNLEEFREESMEGKSIVYREFYSLFSYGEIANKDNITDTFQVAMSTMYSYLNTLTVDAINDYIVYCNYTNCFYEREQEHSKSFESEIKELNQDIDELNKKLKLKDTKIKGLNTKIKNMKSEFKDESEKLKSSVYKSSVCEELNKKIKSLQDENNKLSADIVSMDNENQVILADSMSQKREISDLKKEIKKLNAIISRNPEAVKELDEINEQEDNVSLEDMIALLKDKSIAVIGFTSGDYEQRFKDVGLNNIRVFDDKVRKITGDYEIGVILASTVKHSHSYRFIKTLKDSQIIYSNSREVNKVIYDIYTNVVDY